MTFLEGLQLAGTILVALGGGGAIVFGLSNWLGKVWADKLMQKEKAKYSRELESLKKNLLQDLESYKIRLKKSEFIFEKEFLAASEFVSLRRSFLPTYSHPNMEWEDACEYMARDLDDIESKLESYISKHGAVLAEDVINLISHCTGIAGENKFEASGETVSLNAMNAAEEVYKKLIEVEKLILNKIHSQTST